MGGRSALGVAIGCTAIAVHFLATIAGATPSAAQDVSALRTSLIEIPIAGATTDSVDVFVDTIQVNAFSSFDPDAITVDLPFSQTTEVFEVTVVDRSGGVVLFSSNYRMATGEFFDSIETEATFDNALTWRFKSRQKPQDEKFRSTDWSEDFRASGSFAGYRGGWTTTLDGELVGTDDDDNTLRVDGPKLDMARGLGTVAYTDKDTFSRVGVGDVGVNSFNTLVHGPLTSRGVSFDAGLANELVMISAGNVYGSNIVGFQRGPEAWDEDNRRTTADISLRPLQSQNLNVEVFGALFDGVRPVSNSFNIATVNEGEKNTVVGGGIKIDAFENRISLQSEMSRSRYANPEDLNFANEFGGSTDIGATYGNAQAHRVGALVWQGEKLQADVFASYNLVDPLFNAMDAFTTADRETWEYGAVATYDIATLSVTRTVFDNNVDDIPNILTTRQRMLNGDFSLDLEEYRTGPVGTSGERSADTGFSGFLAAIPSTISLNARDERVEALNAETVVLNSSINGSEIPNTKNTAFGIGFSWIWANGDTSLNLSRTLFDTRQIGRNTADTTDNFVDLSQSFRGDIWSTTTRLAYGRALNKEVSTRSTTYRYEAGQTFMLDLPDWPTASAGGDVSVEKTNFIVDGNSSLTNTWQVNATLEFSKYFPTSVQDYSPSLALTFVASDTDRRDPNFGASSNSEYSISLVSGFRF